MSTKIFVNYKSKPGPKGINYYECVKEGLDNFVKNRAWDKNIHQNENRNYNVHLEGSYLCHGIWAKIMKNESKNGKPYSHNYFYCKNSAYKNEILFHFDIMNNPNKKSCGLANCCNNKELKEWQKIYHSIGNMTPIPWFKVIGEHYIDGQAIHNALDERWDLFLNVLKNNWNNWCSEKSFTFESYMLLTCQQIYYADVYNDFIKKINNINNIKLKTLEIWNNLINNDSKLISFSEYPEESVANLIINLIKIRCHIIGLLLKKGTIKKVVIKKKIFGKNFELKRKTIKNVVLIL